MAKIGGSRLTQLRYNDKKACKNSRTVALLHGGIMKNKNINVPNILSASRFFLLPLLFIFLQMDMKVAFIISYILVGATDFFDGLIARKFNMLTEVGKKLDSFSDLFFYLASAWFLYKLDAKVITSTPNFQLILVFLGLLVLSFIVSGIICKKPVMMHTFILKLNAVLLYVAVIFADLTDMTYFITFLAILYIVGFIEEIAIFFKFGDIDPDSQSFLHLLQEKKVAAKAVPGVTADAEESGAGDAGE
jgi:phosphatidylglycerophosphate synthase